jgi:CheY-like chemotaxis protein
VYNETLEQRSAVTEELPRRSILIVEDDESLAEVLSIRLGQQGFATTTADCGKLALELAHSGHPNLILLDLRLPDMDGLTICQHLVDDPETAEIPVIIVSGMEKPDIVRQSRAAGCQYFVRKPYDPNALLVLIEQALNEANPA